MEISDSPLRYKLPRFIREPFSAYLAASQQHMTSQQLADYAWCPQYHRRQRSGLIGCTLGNDYREDHGLHCNLLEGRKRFEAEFMVSDGPINPKTERPYGSDTKKFHDWEDDQTKPVLTSDQYALITQMCHSFWLHPFASEFLSEGIADGVLREKYCGVECQVRIDWFSQDSGITEIEICPNLDELEEVARIANCVEQLAFYRAIVRQITGQTVETRIVALEDCEPYRVGVWEIGSQKLRAAEAENEFLLEEYAQCLANDHWPTRFETLRTL